MAKVIASGHIGHDTQQCFFRYGFIRDFLCSSVGKSMRRLSEKFYLLQKRTAVLGIFSELSITSEVSLIHD